MANFCSSKRQFLKVGACASALTCIPLAAHQGHQVGIQMYTLRDKAEENLLRALEWVAKLGYRDIEFAGYFNQAPATLRRHMDVLGLSSPSSHVALTALQNDLDRVIDQCLTLGNQFVVMPYLLPDQRNQGLDGYKRLAQSLDTIGKRCRSEGLFLAYHNHDFEFESMGDQIPYDLLLEVPKEHLLMELDLYWITKAGYSPLDFFQRFPGRFPLWHLKDMDSKGEFADVGKGTIDFDAIFAQRQLAGLRHGFVERDITPDLTKTLTQGLTAVSKWL